MKTEKKEPEVSVILPFYNSEKTIERAIKSILHQTFSDFELILVDNNSNDNSAEIARNFEENDSRVFLFKEEKQGVANAMNCGLKNAKGKFLARMDADDFSLPKRLLKQRNFLIENPEIGFVGSTVKYVSKEENTDGFQRFVTWVNSSHTNNEIELKRFVEIPIVNPTIFFRREIYEKFGACFFGDFPEDYEMQLRYLQAGVKMSKIRESLLEWHDSPTRLTRTDERYSNEAFFKTKARYFFKWSEKNNPFHPKIWIWGAGRKTRQRVKLLENSGLKIERFIDIVKSKPNTVYYTNIPNQGEMFIVSMVTNVGAGEKIRAFLKDRKYVEGQDFILMG